MTPRLFGLGGGCASGRHRFEARYDTRPGLVAVIEALTKEGCEVKNMPGQPDEKRYVHDLCTRCGAVVLRSPAQERV